MLANPRLVRHPNPALSLCQDCPPVGYPTSKTRCISCPRNQSEAYLLGCDARNDNVTIDENPYPRLLGWNGADDFNDWQLGWQDADRERESDDANPDRTEAAKHFSRFLGISVGAVYQLTAFRNMDDAAMRALVERERSRMLTDGSR
jgi:hypothetical protein